MECFFVNDSINTYNIVHYTTMQYASLHTKTCMSKPKFFKKWFFGVTAFL